MRGGNNWRSGQDLNVKINFLSIFKKKFWFTTRFQFYSSDIPWIKQSQGRVLLRLGTRQNSKVLFVPIIIKELEPADGADPEIIQRHRKLGKIIEQYEIDLENWNKEMDEIRQSNPYKINVTENDEWMTSIDIKDDDLLKQLIKILSSSEAEFEESFKK